MKECEYFILLYVNSSSIRPVESARYHRNVATIIPLPRALSRACIKSLTLRFSLTARGQHVTARGGATRREEGEHNRSNASCTVALSMHRRRLDYLSESLWMRLILSPLPVPLCRRGQSTR